MSEEYVLELEHIRKEYPGVVALKDVTLQLKKGEILALIGENGAGKSTLIKCCSGAVIPTSGKIKVNGKEFTSMTPQLASENGIAIIYQEFNNVKELSAAEIRSEKESLLTKLPWKKRRPRRLTDYISKSIRRN